MSFSDAQRAEVFVRDRAMCSFSGKSLWVLDYGATPFWDYDWVDHIKPLSRGGRSVLENAACTASARNSAKRNNGADNQYLFKAGRPTAELYFGVGEVPLAIGRRLNRFAALEPSDWYFNRALAYLVIHCHARWEGASGHVRQERYWCVAAEKKLRKWKKLVDRRDYRSFERRGLVPRRPSPDVALMLELRAVAGQTEILRSVISVARRLYPYYRINCQAVWRFANAASTRERATIVRSIRAKKLIAEVTRRTLVRSHARLKAVRGMQ